MELNITETSTKNLPQNDKLVIGIDLGTTNSIMAVAGVDENILPMQSFNEEVDSPSSFQNFIPVKLLQLPQENLDGTVASHILFPSVVFQADQNEPLYVGMGAKEAKYHFRKGRNVFYSVKMDLGTDRDPFYPGAVSEILNNPVKVSSIILSRMQEAAEKLLQRSLEEVPVVITIPASFQPAQRNDTLKAAKMAGLKISASNLLDEPNAALLAYMNRLRVQLRWNREETVLVFDFGGGTCDISIIDASFSPVRHAITLRNLSISRFEQLGGDDIDNHLVHSFLKQQFYKKTKTNERDWPYSERKYSIWSQLSKIAELLKTRFCEELETLSQASDWNLQEIEKIQITIPPQQITSSKGRILIDQLKLDWKQFQKIMEPFVDVNSASDQDKEYYRLTSIFSPIKDALEKANLEPKEITRILMVGGSSKNPLIEHAIQIFFPDANIERPRNMDYLVAEGAAIHAFTHFILGHDILAPIVGDAIGILTDTNEFIPLVPSGSDIPYPKDALWKSYRQFRVPRNNMSFVDIIICTGGINRPIHVVKLYFGQPIPKNTQVNLNIRLDENKIFAIEAFLPDFPEIQVREIINNPLGVLPMTSKQRERAELEKVIAVAQAEQTLDNHIEEMEQLAEVLIELDRHEEALSFIDLAIKKTGAGNLRQKTLKAKAHSDLGEKEEAHKIYAEISMLHPGDLYAALDAGLSAPDITKKEFFIRRAINNAPSNGYAQYFLGITLLDKGDGNNSRNAFAIAKKYFEIQLQHYPNNLSYITYLASTCDYLGDYQQSSILWKKYEDLKARSGENSIDVSHAISLAPTLQSR